MELLIAWLVGDRSSFHALQCISTCKPSNPDHSYSIRGQDKVIDLAIPALYNPGSPSAFPECIRMGSVHLPKCLRML